MITAAQMLGDDTRSTLGIVLLTIVAVQWGGWHLLRVRVRADRTPLQQQFERAGHAHAGVLVTLALVCLLIADLGGVTGWLAVPARNGVPLAAILMPAGFFLSVVKRGASEPNRLIALVHLGMASLAVGVVSLGVGLMAG